MRRFVATVLRAIGRGAERRQIEWLKLGRFRDKRLGASANQGEYYCFHIFLYLLLFPFGSQLRASGSGEIVVIPYVLSRKLMENAWPKDSVRRKNHSHRVPESHKSSRLDLWI